ncbi:MAG: hypothetical protein M2R45_02072 [Verrucomicrobia subdivision 3 bacterium]|nr:hypothetical protein [Limisphaerales bacterium]MCS1413869.1 hypothetical protein [Limisphaerales bacterium]
MRSVSPLRASPSMASANRSKKPPPPTPSNVERLFPFVIRARILIVGQHVILRSKSQLQFVLITKDISERRRSETLRKLKHYPIVQCFRSTDIEKHFDLKGVKLLGFRKSSLSKSLYAELKEHRINEPPGPPPPKSNDTSTRRPAKTRRLVSPAQQRRARSKNSQKR